MQNVPRILPVFLVLLLGGSSAGATCSVCTPEGTCQPVETSGNCFCNIKYTNRGVAICRPAGVCDLVDATSCDPGPHTNIAHWRVDSSVIRQLEDRDPLIGAALWGATDVDFGLDGRGKSAYLSAGVQEGTLHSPESGGFTWKVTAEGTGNGRIQVRGLLTSESGEVIEFRGELLDSAQEGRLMVERDFRGNAPRALIWKADKAKPAEP